MLSSRTEMQKVIEAARNQSLAAFMQAPTQAQIPAAVPPILPPVIPPAMPEIKKLEKEVIKDQKMDKRDKRRSRSRSRDRKDRSRDRDRRDRRRRERTRSRSRERRERRRRERSRSRDRTRSKERDRRSKDRRSPDKPEPLPKEQKVVWEAPQLSDTIPNIQANLVGTYASLLASNIGNPASILDPQNGFQNKFVPRWSPNNNEPPNSFQRSRFMSDDRFNDQNQGRSRPVNQFNDSQRPGFNSRSQQGIGGRMENNSRESRFSDRQSLKDNTNCCVKLHPYYGGFGEVRRFFQGIFINNTGIKFVNDEFGKRTGIVYIRFAYPEGKEEALQRNGNLLKGQEVDVTHLDDQVFEETVDRFQPSNDNFSEDDSEDSRFRGKNITKYFNRNSSQTPPAPKIFSSLVVEDLPTYAKEQDILKMFSDYSLTSIILVNKPRKVHVAYVQFSNTEDAKKALQDLNKHIVDGKMVTVRPCRDEIFDNIQREQSEIIDSSMEKHNNFKNSSVLLLTRLPLKTTESDISDFFSDIGITPTKIHLMTSSMGFIGEAFCEFNSTDEARAALEKNGTPLGTSVVSVKSVDRSEMENTLGMNLIDDTSPPPSIGLRPNIMPLMGQGQRPFYPRNNFIPGPRGPNFMGPRPRRFPPTHQNGTDDSFGPPGCTVLMENVPYKATVEEILQFFDGYDIPADNILRRYNPNGKPSGESKVIFKTSDDAYQAVHEKQEQKIRDRTVYLSLC